MSQTLSALSPVLAPCGTAGAAPVAVIIVGRAAGMPAIRILEVEATADAREIGHHHELAWRLAEAQGVEVYCSLDETDEAFGTFMRDFERLRGGAH